MDELIAIMGEIRDQLVELNSKIDNLTSCGSNDISDIINAVEGIKGETGYDLTDVCHKLDTIDSSLSTIDSSLSTIDSSLSIIDSSLSTIDISIGMID